jgi:hypothetical protein
MTSPQAGGVRSLAFGFVAGNLNAPSKWHTRQSRSGQEQPLVGGAQFLAVGVRWLRFLSWMR